MHLEKDCMNTGKVTAPLLVLILLPAMLPVLSHPTPAGSNLLTTTHRPHCSASLTEKHWWNENWPYRRKITISGAHPENFQIKVVIPPEIPKSMYPSIRFIEDETGDPLPYWIERNEGEYINVAWVRRLENADDEIWMYYGNPWAMSAENGEDVFLSFADFGGYRRARGWNVLNTFGVGWRGGYVVLFDLGDQMAKIENKPSLAELTTERVIEFRVRARSVYRGGLFLSGPGSFGGQREYACIHSISGYRFFSDGEQSPAIVEAGRWYIGRVLLYSNDKIRASFLYGEDNGDYRRVVWVSSEKTNNWNPLTNQNSYCDKYNLAVWDGGGTSSYHFDWFFVRRYLGQEPSTSVNQEEIWQGPPPPAVLLQPEDGAVTGSIPTLVWVPSPISSSQILQISQNEDFSTVLVSENLAGGQGSYTPLVPLPDGSYCWRVISASEGGQTPSGIRRFRVDTRPKPSQFNLLSPWDGRTISDRRPLLVWENSWERALGLSHYEIWVDGVNIDNVPAGVTEWRSPPLDPGIHTWWIVAVGRSGASTASQVFTFEVREVDVVGADENSFVLRTGEYILSYAKSSGFISVFNENCGSSRILRLIPGGGDPNLQVLSPGNVEKVTVENGEENITARISGTLWWAEYEVLIILPKGLPRTVNYRLAVRPTISVQASQNLFSGEYPEFRYTDNTGSDIDPMLIDYLDGLPNAWSGGLHDEYCRDLNQFVFFGDPTVLRSTFLYYCDFTSLNRFFERSRNFFTTIDGYTHHTNDVVRQPPGFFRTSKSLPISFGYDVPTNKGVLPENERLLVSNGIFSLYPSCPGVYSTTDYMKIFIKSLYSIYQLVEKPATVYTYWPGVVENSIRDLMEQDAELAKIGRRGGLHPYGITSYSIYAERFQSENAARFVENARRIIAGKYNPNYTNRRGSRGIFGSGGTVEPVHFLYDYCEWAIYAEHFNDENVKSMFVDTADVIMDLGRGVDYVFTFRVDVYNSAPIEDGGYQFEAVGQYIFIMLYYYRFTDNVEFLKEAKRAAEALLHMGFEFSYEFFATPIGALALLRLYELTGDPRYLDGSYIPLATILRDSWLFNPDFRWGVQNYENRVIFLLTSARPNLSYANGWEEQALIKYLYLYLLEGRDILMPEAVQLTSELLRYKGTSARDSLAPFHQDKSNIYAGVPREWPLPVNPDWFIPLEGFGISRFDEKLGAISQPPYCAGMLPELAFLQFHPLGKGLYLYTEGPAELRKENGRLAFRLLAVEGKYRCALGGERSALFILESESGEGLRPVYDGALEAYTFEAEAGKWYSVIPVAFSVSPPDGTVTSNSRPTFSWEVLPGTENVRLLVAADTKFENVVLDVFLGPENSFTPQTALADGRYWWRIVLSGDFGEAISKVHTITIDTVPPAVRLTQKPPENTRDNLLSFVGEAEDQTTSVVSVEFSVDGGRWSALDISPAPLVRFSLLVELSGGVHTVSLRAVDMAGNISQPITHTVCIEGAQPAETPRPNVIVENLRLSEENVRPGETVTVSVDVANVGTAAGSRTIVLKINGVEVENRTVELAAGQRTTVSFQISVQEVGTHTVSVDGLSATLTVSRPRGRLNPYLLCAVITILIVLGILLTRHFR